VGLKLSGTHHLLAYADGANLLESNMDTIKKNTETLIDASKVGGLEINVERTKYMLLKGSVCFENMSQFRYLGTTATNQICIQEELKRRMNSGNAYYHLV
jgi:hypothetical protein